MEMFQLDMSRLTAISEPEFIMQFYKKEKQDIIAFMKTLTDTSSYKTWRR